jgi:hypothetical protein
MASSNSQNSQIQEQERLASPSGLIPEDEDAHIEEEEASEGRSCVDGSITS